MANATPKTDPAWLAKAVALGLTAATLALMGAAQMGAALLMVPR